MRDWLVNASGWHSSRRASPVDMPRNDGMPVLVTNSWLAVHDKTVELKEQGLI